MRVLVLFLCKISPLLAESFILTVNKFSLLFKVYRMGDDEEALEAVVSWMEESTERGRA
jgi:hypothetical protein